MLLFKGGGLAMPEPLTNFACKIGQRVDGPVGLQPSRTSGSTRLTFGADRDAIGPTDAVGLRLTDRRRNPPPPPSGPWKCCRFCVRLLRADGCVSIRVESEVGESRDSFNSTRCCGLFRCSGAVHGCMYVCSVLEVGVDTC
jgi:hypothetical protein